MNPLTKSSIGGRRSSDLLSGGYNLLVNRCSQPRAASGDPAVRGGAAAHVDSITPLTSIAFSEPAEGIPAHSRRRVLRRAAPERQGGVVTLKWLGGRVDGDA